MLKSHIKKPVNLNSSNFDYIERNGVKAKSLKPIFPSFTFPNHYSIATGCYADKHGILGNEFMTDLGHYSYKDKNTVEIMIKKSLAVLKKFKKKYEIIIVDDGCPQNSGKLAAAIAKKFANIKVFFHKKNLGYGTAIRTGIKRSKNDWIFITDGDNEFDVKDLLKLLKAAKYNDLVISFRHKKIYNTQRIVISWTYNIILRLREGNP